MCVAHCKRANKLFLKLISVLVIICIYFCFRLKQNVQPIESNSYQFNQENSQRTTITNAQPLSWRANNIAGTLTAQVQTGMGIKERNNVAGAGGIVGDGTTITKGT